MTASPVTYLMIGFLSVVLIRGGLFLDQAGHFDAIAAPSDISEGTDGQDNANEEEKPPIVSIKDKLFDPEATIKKKDDFNSFAFKEVEASAQSDGSKVCITGPMLKAAKERLEYLKQKEKDLTEQARLVEISDRRVREQVAKLQLIKEQIIEQAQLADSKVAKESKRLISIYEKMKPKAAANIFNEMAPKVAAELLRSMKEDQSSAILAKMSPKAAYDVTLALAHGIEDTKTGYKSLQ
ncbi:MAG: hypothetical protein AAF621_00945 [Pseudomonadota bacterium]